MRKLLFLIICAQILSAAQTGFGQRTMPGDPGSPQAELMRRIDDKRELMNRRNGIDENGMIDDRPNPRIRPYPRTKPDGKPYTKEERARIEALKKPNEADAARYAGFLKQPKTGLFRLFPYLNCVNKNLIRVDAECADHIPDSGVYSFRTKNYSHSSVFDIKFKDGELIAGSVLSLGIVTALGDVALENVTPASGGLPYLTNLVPETEDAKVKSQRERFTAGIEADGFKYVNRIKAQENMTYALRVVAYRMPGSTKLRLITDDGYDFNPLEINIADERKDITVAFRIVRKDADNITILWKELNRTDAPKLVFPKDVRLLIVKAE